MYNKTTVVVKEYVHVIFYDTFIFYESNTLIENSEDFIDEPIKGEVPSKQNDIEDHSKREEADPGHPKEL